MNSAYGNGRTPIIRQTYLAYALEGPVLRHLAAPFGVETDDDDTDQGIKDEIVLSITGQATGSLESFRANCLRADVGIADVDDVQVEVATNGRDVTVYPAVNQAALSTVDQAALLAYLTAPSRTHIGDTVAIGAVTRVEYSIVATVRFDSAVTDSTQLELEVRTAAYAFIDEQARPGATIYQSGIISALQSPNGALSVTLTTPNSDIAKVDGQINYAQKNATGVALTLTAI